MTPDVDPLPSQPSTLSPVRATPGATPTTDDALSRAPMVPATWVPWPLQSVLRPSPVQLPWPTTLRSGWAAMPVSIT